MTTEFARVESAVNSVLGKPVAVVLYGLMVTSRWTIKRAARLVKRMRNIRSAMPAKAART